MLLTTDNRKKPCWKRQHHDVVCVGEGGGTCPEPNATESQELGGIFLPTPSKTRDPPDGKGGVREQVEKN